MRRVGEREKAERVNVSRKWVQKTEGLSVKEENAENEEDVRYRAHLQMKHRVGSKDHY